MPHNFKYCESCPHGVERRQANHFLLTEIIDPVSIVYNSCEIELPKGSLEASLFIAIMQMTWNFNMMHGYNKHQIGRAHV